MSALASATVCVSISASLLRLQDGTDLGAVAYLRDVTERRRTEEELARSNAQLEHYVDAVSHDLRSPLQAIQTSAELLPRLSPLTREQTREVVHIQAIVRRMSTISLGRMRAKETISRMRRLQFSEGLQASTGVACAWAIHYMTGEPMPEMPPQPYRDNAWFLTPEPLPPRFTSSAARHPKSSAST